MEVAMKLFQTHFPSKGPAALKLCFSGSEMSSLQCRIVTTGCTELSLAQTSPFSHCVLPSWANYLLCFLMTVICREIPWHYMCLWTGEQDVLCVMRKRGWWSKQDVFWHRDWTRCSEMSTHSKDCSQGGATEKPQSTQISCHTSGLFLKVSTIDIDPLARNS